MDLKNVKTDKNGVVYDVLCDDRTPYLTLGFGKDKSEVNAHMFSSDNGSEGFDEPRESFFQIPWASEITSALFSRSWVYFELSPYLDVIGYASSLSCFIDEHVACINIPENFTVRVAYRTFSGVKGVVYPIKYPKDCSKILCRTLLIESRIQIPNHCLSTGIGLKIDCNTSESAHSFKLDDYNSYYIRNVNEETIVHNPCRVRAIPEFLSDDILIVKQKFVGWFAGISLFCCMITPGIFQYFGTEDNSWGVVLNETIGTGSVLVTAILVLFYRFFGTSTISRRSIDGTYSVKNNFTAKWFAWKKVQDIEKVACDLRIPPNLISNYRNSLSRKASKDGWLRISNGVPVSNMPRHGYIPILDKGLVIDCLKGWYLTCSPLEESNKLKLNWERSWRVNKRRLYIKETDVFE